MESWYSLLVSSALLRTHGEFYIREGLAHLRNALGREWLHEFGVKESTEWCQLEAV